MLSLYWKRFKSNRMTIAGTILVLGLVLMALLSPWIMPHDPFQQDLLHRLKPPDSHHWFGTDELGRDVFSRILFGTRISLAVGVVVTFISITIGMIIGLISGYWRGKLDSFFMRVVDIVLCFPTLYLILMLLAILDKPSIMYTMIIIAVTSWPGLARMVRGEVLSVRERDFILVAKGLGVSTPRILFVHVLPNVISPILVAATFSVGSAILTESGL